MGPQRIGHRPAVGRCFQRDLVGGLKDLGGEQFQHAAVQSEAFAMHHVAGLVDDAGLDHALVDIEADGANNTIGHGSFSLDGARPEGEPPGRASVGASGAAAVEVWTTSPFFTSAEVGPRRQLPLRARSSTGWAGGALRYDGGLTAHRCSRAAPKCPGLPVLLFLEWFRKRFMVSCVSRRRHFVPNPVQRNYSHRPAAQRRRPQSIHTGYDVVGVKDKYDLMRFDSSGAVASGMFDESWRRFVVKMATGAGKTKVLSLVLVWSFFHKLYEPDSKLARNFLVIAPNIIVLDRIRKDFDGLKIFFQDPALPDNGFDGRNWRDDFQLTLHVQDEVRVCGRRATSFSRTSTASMRATSAFRRRTTRTRWTIFSAPGPAAHHRQQG